MLETESARFIAHVGIDDKQAIEMTKTVANMRVLMAQSRDRGSPSPLMTLLTAGLLGELHAKSHLAGLTFKEGEK